MYILLHLPQYNVETRVKLQIQKGSVQNCMWRERTVGAVFSLRCVRKKSQKMQILTVFEA